MAVAFFDLDRTLLSVNSGTLWVRAEFKAGRITWSQMGKAAWWIFRYSLGDDDLTFAFEQAVASMEGLEEEVIVQRTHDWFTSQVQQHLRPGGAEALRRHREAGDTLVLATSGTLYAAREANAAFGLHDLVCTIPEVKDGRFTGRIASLAFAEHKLHRVREWAQAHGESLDEAWFYTDSASDLALLEAVGHPVVIAPDRKLAKIAAERGWPIEEW